MKTKNTTIKFSPEDRLLIKTLKECGFPLKYIAENSGVGYVHFTRIMKLSRKMAIKTRKKLLEFKKIKNLA